jgi:short-subunit dehydrogenase
MELRGAVCLVTGATAGIGRSTATALAAEGAEVVASGVEDLDLTAPGAPALLAARALERHGRVDVLVNCAGAGSFGSVEDADTAGLFALNAVAPIELAQALVPGMRERGRGHVVNVGSIVGHVGRPREAVYAATKAALAIFTESLRAELRDSGVGVSLVTPAAVATGFFEQRGAPYGRRRPALQPPERIAAAIVDAIRRDRAELIVPRWLGVAVRVHGAAPRLYRVVASRLD